MEGPNRSKPPGGNVMRIPIALFLILLCTLSVPAQAGDLTNFRETGHYVGTVGNEGFQVAVYKSLNDGVVGRSWYSGNPDESQSNLSYSHGTLQYTLVEQPYYPYIPHAFDSPKPVTFTGEFKRNEFVGARSATSQAASQPVKLTRVADYVCRSYQDSDVNAHYVHPVLLGDSKAFKKINQLQSEKARKSLAEFVKTAHGMAGSEYYYAWWVEDCQFVKYCSPDIISLLNDRNEYTGGAHENRNYESTNYWIRDGIPQPLTLSSLFRKDAPYVKTISRELSAVLNPLDVGTDAAASLFEAKELTCFTIDQAGLTFHFDSGTVTCITTTDLSIPYAKLAKVIDPKGPLAKFLPQDKSK